MSHLSLRKSVQFIRHSLDELDHHPRTQAASLYVRDYTRERAACMYERWSHSRIRLAVTEEAPRFVFEKPVTSLILAGLGLLGSFPIGALMLVTIGTLLGFVTGVVAIPGTLFFATLGTVMLFVLVPAMCCIVAMVIIWKIYLAYLAFIVAVRRLICEFKLTSYNCVATVVPAPVLELVNISPPLENFEQK